MADDVERGEEDVQRKRSTEIIGWLGIFLRTNNRKRRPGMRSSAWILGVIKILFDLNTLIFTRSSIIE